MELPFYTCHKQVRAIKIAGFDYDTAKDRYLIIPDNTTGITFIEVDNEYFAKHKPHIGGYYVVYEDDYKSFSPAKAFEAGYTLSK